MRRSTGTPFDQLVVRYRECFSEASGIATTANTVGIEVDGQALAAMAAVLFIARDKRNI